MKSAITCLFACAVFLTLSVSGSLADESKSSRITDGLLSLFSSKDSGDRPDKTLLLDEKQLIENTYQRLLSTIKANNPMAPGLENFTKDNLKIMGKEPIYIGSTNLWMVKMGMSNLPQMDDEDTTSFEMELVVDPSGTYQFAEVMDIKNNKSMFLAARRVINKKDVPGDMGTPLAAGQGVSSVLLISDPFCSFCRAEYSYLKEIMSYVGTLKVQHMPMTNLYPASEITCAFLELAKEKMTENEFSSLMDFVYSDFQPPQVTPQNPENPSVSATQKMEMDTLALLLAKYPTLQGGQELEALYYLLKGKYVTLVKSKAEMATKLFNVSGTPMTVIDGSPIRGFNKTAINDALGIR